jgi:hypothetical protein
MRTAAKWVLGILPAGIALGVLLGAAVDPHMKDAPAPWWRLSGFEETDRPEDHLLAETSAESPGAAGGYRPDLDYDLEVWALRIPSYDLAALANEALAAPPVELPAIYDGTAPAAANEEGADDAPAADEPAAAPEAAPNDVRKAELAQDGLY